MSETLQGPQSTRDITISMKPTDITRTLKPISFNTNTECKWTKYSNQKTQGIRMDKKQDPSICYLQETNFRPEDTFRLKVKGWRIIYHALEVKRKLE